MPQNLILMSKERHTQIPLCLCRFLAEFLGSLFCFGGSGFLLLLGFLFLCLPPEP